MKKKYIINNNYILYREVNELKHARDNLTLNKLVINNAANTFPHHPYHIVDQSP
jgi:hypothetical protein